MQRISLALLAVLACLTPGPVFASACSNPNGNEADEIYNYAYHTKQFCNGSTWIAEGAAGGSGGPMLISTQTASSSASLQFTNLPTTYNTLFLNCADLLTNSSSATLFFVAGEGSGPTWKTAAHYTVEQIGTGTGQNSPFQAVTTTALDFADNTSGSSTSVPESFKMYIDNVGSSSVYKIATVEEGVYTDDGSGFFMVRTSSYWNADTFPITGLEVYASGGTISSGTCSLYGMN